MTDAYCPWSDLPRRTCSCPDPACASARTAEVSVPERAEAMRRVIADGTLITREQAFTTLSIESIRLDPEPSAAPRPPGKHTIERDGPPTGEACLNGCERLNQSTGRLEPVRTYPPAVVCDACTERLHGFLSNVEQHYPRVRDFILPGSAEADPDAPRGPRDDRTVVPLRVAVIDLTDTRHKRRVYDDDGSPAFNPDAPPLANRRGATGVVQRWAEQVRVERHTDTPAQPRMDTEVDYLTAHLDYTLTRPWVPKMFHDLRKVSSAVLDAVGIQRRKVIGYCDTLIDDPDTDEPPYTCAGPMFALRDTFGVFCARCHRRYGIDELDHTHARPLVTRRLAPTKETADS